MPTHVLILGAGFGGLELAARLSESGDPSLRVTLVEQSDAFVFGFAKFDVLFGRRTFDQVKCPYRDVSLAGVQFRQERVTSVEPRTRRVVTDRAAYRPDVLVVALGATYEPAATPGFAEDGFEFYSLPGADRLRRRLASFAGGEIIVAILRVPFKCPPAPYESALLLHEYLVERGLRDASSIEVITPMDSPIPVSPAASAAIVAGLAEHGIRYTPRHRVREIDPVAHVAHLKSETRRYDLFIGIPAHRVPTVVEESGLTAGGTDGWIAVDRRTLATPYPNVYAIGDCADAPSPAPACLPRPRREPSPTTSSRPSTAQGRLPRTTAEARATSSSGAAASAGWTPTSSPARHRPRRSSDRRSSSPPRKPSSPRAASADGSPPRVTSCRIIASELRDLGRGGLT